MYLHLYDNSFCKKSKNILYDPLKTNFDFLREKKFSHHILKSLFSEKYRLQCIIFNSYEAEQKFIVNNHESITSELERLDFNHLYKKYNAPLHMYLIDLIIDYYKVSKHGTEKESIYIEKLISFFYMNEILFYISNNNVEIKKTKNIISISPKEDEYRYLQRRWFAYTWEEESKKANIGLSIFANLTIPKDRIADAVRKLSDLYMDKVFSLHPDYISTQNKRKEQYIFLCNLCNFFSLLHICPNNKILKNDPILKQLGLTKNNFIKELEQINTTLTTLDKGFFIEDNIYVLDDTLDLYNVLKMYLIVKYQKNLSNISAKFGKMFEEYIKIYIQKNAHADYKLVSDNIDFNEEGINVDIDLTLYDKNRNFYYFIQAKYAISNKPYLKDEVKSICNNKTLKKGLKQLQGFRKALKQKKFRQILANKGIKIHNDNNYSLILIHTISQFDFHDIDNIQMYEWNNFRNLLQRGMQQYMNINLNNPTRDVIQNKSTLELENVDVVLQTTMNNAIKDYNSQWNKFKNTFFRFKLNNCLYESNIK